MRLQQSKQLQNLIQQQTGQFVCTGKIYCLLFQQNSDVTRSTTTYGHCEECFSVGAFVKMHMCDFFFFFFMHNVKETSVYFCILSRFDPFELTFRNTENVHRTENDAMHRKHHRNQPLLSLLLLKVEVLVSMAITGHKKAQLHPDRPITMRCVCPEALVSLKTLCKPLLSLSVLGSFV